MKTLRLISFMVLGYGTVALYMALVYAAVNIIVFIGEEIYEHNNRIHSWLDNWSMFWIRHISSLERRQEEIKCHFWARFSELLSPKLSSASLESVLRRWNAADRRQPAVMGRSAGGNDPDGMVRSIRLRRKRRDK